MQMPMTYLVLHIVLSVYKCLPFVNVSAFSSLSLSLSLSRVSSSNLRNSWVNWYTLCFFICLSKDHSHWQRLLATCDTQKNAPGRNCKRKDKERERERERAGKRHHATGDINCNCASIVLAFPQWWLLLPFNLRGSALVSLSRFLSLSLSLSLSPSAYMHWPMLKIG